MTIPTQGAIDCDVHPSVPDTAVLLPYLDDYWRDQIVNRHIHKGAFHLQSYPPNSPLSCRPDWRPPSGFPGSDLELLRQHALDPFGSRLAICNTLHGAIALFNEDLSAALCSAVNDWIAKEWLDREPRLRASILVPMHNPELAVREIERLAPDRRFVQVLVPVMGDAARAPHLADLPGRREARSRHRHACRQHYRHAPRRRAGPPTRSRITSSRRRVREPALSFWRKGLPDSESNGLHRIRRHLAADAAGASIRRGAVRARCLDRPAARRHPPRPRALHLQPMDVPPATEKLSVPSSISAAINCFVLDRLPALAFRRRQGAARRASRAIMRRCWSITLETYPRLRDGEAGGSKPSRTEEAIP